MLLKELREELNKYKEDDLKQIICELYKSIPKVRRDEKDIDQIIKDFTTYKLSAKADKKQKEDINIEQLKTQIELFIDYAYKQYYFAPNQYVHKKDRPKWRFIIKDYIKKLESIPSLTEEGRIASDLLRRLYEVLSYACSYWIFNSDNPFRSIGIEQTEALDKVLTRILAEGIDVKSIETAIKVTINSEVDRETLHTQLITVLVSKFKTTDTKEIAIEQCKAIVKELDEQWNNTKKKSYSRNDYAYKEKVNLITTTVFYLCCTLCEYDEAILYFQKNFKKQNKEVALFYLLELLYQYDLKENWIEEYEKAVSEGIKPREGLQRTYKILKETGQFGDRFYYNN